MNVETGRVYSSRDEAILFGERPEEIVEVRGTPDQVARLSEKVASVKASTKLRNRAANKRARKSRKRNR